MPIEDNDSSIKNYSSNKIENLVLSGGGAKGALYPGAYRAMHEAGVLQNVRSIAGSSAGAIISTFMAFGMHPSDMEAKMATTDMAQLLGTGTFLITGIKSKIAPISKDGAPLEKFISDSIKESTLKNIGKSPKKSKLTPELEEQYAKELEEIRSNCLENNPHKALTFRHLKILREIDPVKFKTLQITATSMPDENTKGGRMQVFDHDTPDVPVAAAAVASGSLPVLFKPKVINGVSYADGGWIDNIPTPEMIEVYKSYEYLNKGQKINDILESRAKQNPIQLEGSASKSNSKQNNTLLLAFGKEDEKNCQSFQALFSNKDPYVGRGLLEKIVIWLASWKIKGKESYDEHDKRTYRVMQNDYALRTVRLSTDLGTADFSKATSKNKQLLLEGFFHQQDYLINYGFSEEKQGYKHARFFFEAFKNFEKSEKFYSHTSDPNRSIKAEKLFGMAEPHQYENMSQDDLKNKLAEYIRTACISRNSASVSATTRSMEAFVKTLNDNKTPSEIRASCAEILCLGLNKKDADKHKFTKNDFKDFIAANKDQLLSEVKGRNDVKPHTNKISKRADSFASQHVQDQAQIAKSEKKR